MAGKQLFKVSPVRYGIGEGTARPLDLILWGRGDEPYEPSPPNRVNLRRAPRFLALALNQSGLTESKRMGRARQALARELNANTARLWILS